MPRTSSPLRRSLAMLSVALLAGLAAGISIPANAAVKGSLDIIPLSIPPRPGRTGPEPAFLRLGRVLDGAGRQRPVTRPPTIVLGGRRPVRAFWGGHDDSGYPTKRLGHNDLRCHLQPRSRTRSCWRPGGFGVQLAPEAWLSTSPSRRSVQPPPRGRRRPPPSRTVTSRPRRADLRPLSFRRAPTDTSSCQLAPARAWTQAGHDRTDEALSSPPSQTSMTRKGIPCTAILRPPTMVLACDKDLCREANGVPKIPRHLHVRQHR